MHRSATRVLSALLVIIGVVMLIATITNGGGPLSYGVIVGVLFVAAGAARFWLARDSGR